MSFFQRCTLGWDYSRDCIFSLYPHVILHQHVHACLHPLCFSTYAPLTWRRQSFCFMFLPKPQWPLWPLHTVDKTTLKAWEQKPFCVLSCSWYHPSHAHPVMLRINQVLDFSNGLYQRPLKWKLYELLSLLTITLRSARHGLTFNQALSWIEISHAIQARCGLAPRPQKCAYCAWIFQRCWPYYCLHSSGGWKINDGSREQSNV